MSTELKYLFALNVICPSVLILSLYFLAHAQEPLNVCITFQSVSANGSAEMFGGIWVEVKLL